MVLAGGLIPAGAGSTAGASGACRTGTAHPRRRGEHARLGPVRTPCSGSSPQARGARGVRRASRRGKRLIPAGAGSTLLRRQSRGLRRAHPRRRGEHVVRHPAPRAAPGSSPQARGAPHRRGHRPGPARLIPAGAGSTWSRGKLSGSEEAHPRRRGEHGVPVDFGAAQDGSSPQARGAQHEPAGNRPPDGLIPAGAGSTLGD